MRRLRFLVLLACVHCGSATMLEETDASSPDAPCGSDASIGADAGGVDSEIDDAVILDHGTNGYSDAPLPQCRSDVDCDGWATCQMGLCCSGALTDAGTCLCGDTPGCDLRHACCVPFSSTTGKSECVSDCATQCGCTQPPR